MPDPSDLYPYSSGQLFEKPNHYMYTPFHGEDFLRAYISKRRAFIKNLTGRVKESPPSTFGGVSRIVSRAGELHTLKEVTGLFGNDAEGPLTWTNSVAYLDQALEAGTADTRALLNALLSCREQGLNNQLPAYKTILSQLKRNFEVRRLVFESYDRKLKRGSGDTTKVGNYAALAFLTALDLDGSKNLQTTNVLLKLNDVLLAYEVKLEEPLEQAFSLVSVAAELTHIENLMQQERVSR